MVGAPLSGRSPSGPRPPLQQPCGDASQGLRAAFHFASRLVPIFHQPPFVIPSSQSTNPPTLLAGFFPRPLNCALSQHQETPELELLLSMLPSFPPEGSLSAPSTNCRDRGLKLRRKSLAPKLLSALSSGQWTPLRPVDIKRPMVESGADDMDAVDDDVRTSRLFGPPVSDRVLLLARLP